METVHRINQLLLKVEKIIAALLIGGIAVCVILQVCFRYLFASPLAWTDELARYLQVWMAFIGSAIAADRLSHFHLDLIHQYVPRKVVVYVDVLVLLATLGFAAILGYYGVQILDVVQRQFSPAMNIRMNYAYLAIPVGSLLIVWHLIVHILDKLFLIVSAAKEEQV